MARTPATTIVETCPACGSLDVRAVEPGWFALDLARRTELSADVHVDFTCRDCGDTWR